MPKFRLETFTYKRGKTPGESTIPYGITEKSAIEWLLNMVLTDGGVDSPRNGHSFKTREKFASSVQPFLRWQIYARDGYGLEPAAGLTIKIFLKN